VNKRAYFAITAIIFGLVAVIHLLRVLNQWPLLLGQWSIPMWMSWLGAVVTCLLCIWALALMLKRK
jgi:hypothetical protein